MAEKDDSAVSVKGVKPSPAKKREKQIGYCSKPVATKKNLQKKKPVQGVATKKKQQKKQPVRGVATKKMQQQEKFVNVVDSEEEGVEDKPVHPTPKKWATYRFKQIGNPYDFLPAKPLTQRREDEYKALLREAKQAECQHHQQLHYEPFLNPNKFQFTDAKPSGLGAFDLTQFEIGDDSKPPTMSDVEKLSNTDFPQSNLIITCVSSITRI